VFKISENAPAFAIFENKATISIISGEVNEWLADDEA
jgi:hypothetical protein